VALLDPPRLTGYGYPRAVEPAVKHPQPGVAVTPRRRGARSFAAGPESNRPGSGITGVWWAHGL